jgi:hypothetical protein
MIKSKIIIITILFSGLLFSQSKIGTTAADFLTIPVGPRAAAMGGAFTAVANDVTAAYWNPGGLSRIGDIEFAASFAQWIGGSQLNWFGLNYQVDENDAFAISINQLNYGQEEITTVDQPNGTGQNWSAADIALSLSYARNLTDRFSIGGTVKYINQKIWNESASAFALDIGLLFYTELPGFNIGMNISNFGTEMQLSGKDLLQPVDIDPAHAGNNSTIASNLATDSWPLPLQFDVGVSYMAINTQMWKWTVAGDAVIPSNQTSYLNLGTELNWDDLFSIRGGYYSINRGGGKIINQSQKGGLSTGVGLHYNFGGFYAKIDYSYTSFGVFDPINRISITLGL